MRVSHQAFIALITLVAAGAVPALRVSGATGGGSDAPVVYCYDKARDNVTRELSGNCKGTVISAADADTIAARRSQRTREMLYDRPAPLFSDRKLFGIGTGFYITRDGKLLTNYHVVDACAGISIEPAAGGSVRAALLAYDKRRDLALLQAEAQAPATASFAGPAMPMPGEAVVTVGYPNQGLAPVRPLVTAGQALGPSGNVLVDSHFAINADVRHGNSGGPVLDPSNRVVGVVQAKIDTVKVYKATRQLVDNVGIAIANAVVLDFLRQQHVDYRSASANAALSPAQLFEAAKPYIARVGCWK